MLAILSSTSWLLLASGSLISFLLGLFFGRRARLAQRAAAESGPVVVQVNGVKEPIVIPEHYNSAAIDKLLKQLEIA